AEGSPGVGTNVTSFAIDLGSGNLSLVNSNASTCPTPATQANPEPCGLPLDILLDPTGAIAFVLDQGAPPCPTCSPGSPNTPIAPAIYPYTVNSDGSLSNPGTAVTWSCPTVNANPCTYSDTAEAMVRDASGQFLYVIDYGSYPTPGYPTPSPTNPSCPHVPTGPTDVCPSISVFAMPQPPSTSLTLASGSPFYLSKIPSALAPITFTPPGGTAEELLFVTNNLDVCTQNCIPPSPQNDNTVSIYNVSSSGVLSELTNSPYTVSAASPSSVQVVNTGLTLSGGLFVYVGQGSGVGAVYPFTVCWVQNANCTAQDVAGHLMVPLTTCSSLSCVVPPSSVGPNPVEMLVDPTNNFLYVLSEGQNQVSAFSIGTSTGKLTPLTPPNLPTGSQPVSMAIHPSVNSAGQSLYNNQSGQFLYTSNTTSGNISGFTLSTTSGSMSNSTTAIAPAAPSGIAVH
ncbi:MAG: hypothetical protein WAM98_03280, partial [Terriglobales bacterium]